MIWKLIQTKLFPFIVTLGSYTYVRGLAYVISAGYPITLHSSFIKFLGAGDILSIPTPIYTVYAISGLLSGLAGVILTGRLYSAQPTAGIGFELDAIAAVILGGTSFTGGIGKVQGTINSPKFFLSTIKNPALWQDQI